MIERVQQEDVSGCGIACVAMVTGKGYQDVLNSARGWGLENDFKNRHSGTCEFLMADLLLRFGYAAVTIFKTDQITSETRENWPNVQVGAHAYILSARVPSGGHWVVVHDGKVYDPDSPHRTSLTDPLFLDFCMALAVFKI